jgi:hypothetical protein
VLTDKGLDLAPMLLELVAWSDRYLRISDPGRALARRFRDDRGGLLLQLQERLPVAAPREVGGAR